MPKKKRKKKGPPARPGRAVRKEIKTSLEEAIKIGIQLHQNGNLEEAEGIYGEILKKYPKQVDTLHFMGVLKHQLGNSEEAVELIAQAVALRPDYMDAQNNLGNVYKELGLTAEAEELYRRVLDLSPDHADAWNNLGAVIAKTRREEAITLYEKAIRLNPQHADAFHNLGNALNKLDRLDEAIAAYERSIELNPDGGKATLNLGRALFSSGKIGEATSVFRTWLAREPGNPIAKHMLSACSGEDVPGRASDDFITQTFDSFARSFDEVLKELDYKAPQLVTEAFAAIHPAPGGDLHILDAGCGTGLCGPLLRPYAGRLVGVDLSDGMLKQARLRNVYDSLEAAELVAFMRGASTVWDVIVSADTLVYFGPLDEVLDATAAALKSGGTLIFTVEHEREEDNPIGYRMNPHGRYSHREPYVRQTLADAGLVLREIGYAILRKENKQGVDGLVVSAQKQ